MAVRVQFLGAAREVTGSKHLISLDGHRVLLDCGMVQGPRRLANRRNLELPLDPRTLDAVVLSHAHVDHSGALPRLVKLGFRGVIHCTHATRDLLGILLPDSAHLQASDARHLRKHGHAYEPPYAMEDVDATLGLLCGHDYGEPLDVAPGVRARFLEAGHILGSAQVVLDLTDGGRTLRLGFTGDLGRHGLPILRDPAPLPPCDHLITESTYGDRSHPPVTRIREELAAFFAKRESRAGRVLIPAFSVGRTQNLLWYLGQLVREGTLEPQEVYVDSPLSTKATAIVARHHALFDREARELLRAGGEPFYFEGVTAVGSPEESKALNALRRGVIISASGMCEGGRILHHLEQTLPRREDCVLLVGFQAQGTLGRRLLDGHEHVKVFGERLPVRCQVRSIEGLSAHADRDELLAHLAPQAASARGVFVVHGEEDPATRFADRLRGAGFRNVEVPNLMESFELASP